MKNVKKNVAKKINATYKLQKVQTMENVNKTQLGERIRELRTVAGHTQDDLAVLLDKHRQVVSYYENGTRTPNLNELITIAKEYNTTTDYLLGLSDTATNDTDIKAICDYTGLDELSISVLKYFGLTKNKSENADFYLSFLDGLISLMFVGAFGNVSEIKKLISENNSYTEEYDFTKKNDFDDKLSDNKFKIYGFYYNIQNTIQDILKNVLCDSSSELRLKYISMNSTSNELFNIIKTLKNQKEDNNEQ